MDRDGDHDGARDDNGDLYELEVDEGATEEAVQAVIEEAVAAVDKRRSGHDEASPVAGDSGAQAAELKDRLMRTLADFDNFRKRTDREKENLRRYAVVDLLKDMLGVFDNLERALGADGNVEELKTGLQMVMRQHDDVLKRHGVARVAAVGEPFDPTVHEAVMREESAEVEVPTVTKELQSGYKVHDRLLRPAMVNVAVPATDGDS